MTEFPAIIAALPRELTGLTHGWKAQPQPGKVAVWTNGFAVAACAGMGARRVSLAVQAALACGPVTSLLSTGFAGACNPALAVGDIVRAGTVVDSRTGERFSDSQFTQVLVTSSQIASVREKTRLREAYGADAVDMEAAEVARLAQAHGIYFEAIKVISDTSTSEVESLLRFATPDGQFREAAFAIHSALRPHRWGGVIALGRSSRRSLAMLTKVLEKELDRLRNNG